MNQDPDRFHEARVGLTLRKPAGWNFLPPAWSPTAIMKRAPASDEQRGWARHANMPICCAQGMHANPRKPKPTLQVTVRPFPLPGHRIHVLFNRDLALTIGLSGAQNKRYFRESDFDSILASISLD